MKEPFNLKTNSTQVVHIKNYMKTIMNNTRSIKHHLLKHIQRGGLDTSIVDTNSTTKDI